MGFQVGFIGKLMVRFGISWNFPANRKHLGAVVENVLSNTFFFPEVVIFSLKFGVKAASNRGDNRPWLS